MCNREITLILDVEDCTACGAWHSLVKFIPCAGGEGRTHVGVCPAVMQLIWLDTHAHGGAWDGLMRATEFR